MRGAGRSLISAGVKTERAMATATTTSGRAVSATTTTITKKAAASTATSGKVTGTKTITNSRNIRVYRGIDIKTGQRYYGITNNIDRRAGEHEGRIIITEFLDRYYTREEARMVEQLLIKRAGGIMGGRLSNQINSIALKKFTPIEGTAIKLRNLANWASYP